MYLLDNVHVCALSVCACRDQKKGAINGIGTKEGCESPSGCLKPKPKAFAIATSTLNG